MSRQTQGGPPAPWINRPHRTTTSPTPGLPTAGIPCSGSHPASPYALVAAFLRRFVDAAASARASSDGRDELSRLLEIEVTEEGYRSLIAPLYYLLDVDHRRPTDAEIARHGRWWLDQLP